MATTEQIPLRRHYRCAGCDSRRKVRIRLFKTQISNGDFYCWSCTAFNGMGDVPDKPAIRNASSVYRCDECGRRGKLRHGFLIDTDGGIHWAAGCPVAAGMADAFQTVHSVTAMPPKRAIPGRVIQSRNESPVKRNTVPDAHRAESPVTHEAEAAVSPDAEMVTAGRPCAHCLKPFTPIRKDALYCSGRCRTAARRARL